MNNVCAYARFSSQNQRAESIDTQFDVIEKYCKNNDLDIVARYQDEAKSGLTDDRVGFKQMIEDSKDGNWNAIIVYSLDRFGRNAMDHYYYKNILDNYGIRIIAILDGIDGDDNPEKGLLSNIKIGLAEYYSAHLSKVILDADIMGARNSLKMGGIDNIGFNTVEQRYEINEEEAETVRRMFDLALECKSLREIKEIINDEGRRSKLGNPFCEASIYFILRNRKYDGQMIYNIYKRKEKITSKTYKKIMKPENEHVIIPEALPRIIEHDKFIKVQELLNKYNSYHLKTGTSGTCLLSGIVFCGLCGGKMYATNQTCGKEKQKRKIYRCANNFKEDKCKVKPINANYLDEYAIKLFDKVFISNDVIKNIKSVVKAKVDIINKEEELKLKTFNKELQNNNKEVDKLTLIAQQSTGLAKDTIMKAVKTKLDESIKLQSDIASLKAKIDNREKISFIDLNKMINEYKKAKDLNDIKEIRRITFIFIKQVIVTNERIDFIFDLRCFLRNYRDELIDRHSVERDKVALRRKKVMKVEANKNE